MTLAFLIGMLVVMTLVGVPAARIPFLVPAQVVPPWKQASDYGFFAAPTEVEVRQP